LPSKWKLGPLCPIPDLTDGELEVGLGPVRAARKPLTL